MSRTTIASAMAASSAALTTASSLASSSSSSSSHGYNNHSAGKATPSTAANTNTTQGVIVTATATAAPSSSSADANANATCFLSPATSHRVVQTTAHLMNAVDTPFDTDTPTLSTCSTHSLPLSTQPPPASTEEDRKRKAAAAAARRKRRKALIQKAHYQQQHQQQQLQQQQLQTTTLRQPSPQPSPRSVSQQPTAPHPPLMLVEKQQRHQEGPLVLSNSTRTAALPIQPTVQGILEIVQRWKQTNSPVAMPTECTYEACLAIQQDQIDDCSAHARISHLQQATGMTALAVPTILVPPPNKNKTVLDLPFFRPHFAPRIYAVATSAVATPSTTTTTIARPTAPLPRNVMPPTRTSSSLSCTSASSCTSPTSSSSVLVQHTFNENAQVLQRLSAKLWPGPVVIHVSTAAPAQQQGQQQQHNLLYKEFQGTYFIALRSPRHPLAVRLVKEFYRDCKSASNCSNIGEDKNQNALPVACISSALLSRPILLSLPIHTCRHGSSTNPSALPAATSNLYCTTAAQVIQQSEAETGSVTARSTSIAAVLQGEERREAFSILTCEYAQPWPVEVYIQGPPHRTVTIVYHQKKSSGNGCCASGVHQQQHKELLQETASLASAALHPTKKPTTVKEGMVLAVLRKWKVVTTEHSGQ